MSDTPPVKRAKQDEDWAAAETPRHSSAEACMQETPRFGASAAQNEFSKWECGEKYRLLKVLGHGSYGEVAQAEQMGSGRKVAIKRIHNVFDVEMDTKRILREVNILRQMEDERIVDLIDIIPPRDYANFNELYLVFEFVETDLAKLINAPQFLTTEHIKFLMYQLLCALRYMHSASVIHRDIKPANILLNEDCTLKVCDFGLSRVIRKQEGKVEEDDEASSVNKKEDGSNNNDSSSTSNNSEDSKKTTGEEKMLPPKQLQRQLTKHVVTRWYRPPELILLQEYSTPVDVWSAGCIFAELLSMQKESVKSYKERVPLFPGKSCFPLSADNDRTYKDQLDQLNVIFDVIGTPREEDTEHLGEVRNYLKGLKPKFPKDLSQAFPGAVEDAIDLLSKMLVFNPDTRITVQDALKHPFLATYYNREKDSIANGAVLSFDDNIPGSALKEKLIEEIKQFVRPVGM